MFIGILFMFKLILVLWFMLKFFKNICLVFFLLVCCLINNLGIFCKIFWDDFMGLVFKLIEIIWFNVFICGEIMIWFKEMVDFFKIIFKLLVILIFFKIWI